MLNDYYYGDTATCTYCNGLGQEACTNDCTNIVAKIGSTYKNMIESVVWNTGGVIWADPLTVQSVYSQERGTIGKICTSDETDSNGVLVCNDTVARTTTWIGAVGLVYISDYGYASTDTSCSTNTIYTQIITYKCLITIINKGKEVYYVIR